MHSTQSTEWRSSFLRFACIRIRQLDGLTAKKTRNYAPMYHVSKLYGRSTSVSCTAYVDTSVVLQATSMYNTMQHNTIY